MNPNATDALQAHFESLEKVPGAKNKIAERLTRFVLSGEDESAVADLAATNGTQHFLTGLSHISAVRFEPQHGLSSLLKVLPDDPEVYLRLAKVYEATKQSSFAGLAVSWTPIPGFPGSLSWLSTFLGELARGGKVREQIFPVSLLAAMISANGDDPNVLVKGAFFYEDAQGKNQTSKWVESPFAYFQCLQGYADLVLKSSDLVRPAFQQKDAGSRACVLRALIALKISPDPFVTEIAALAVSGSKEVRETAAPLACEHISIFRAPLEDYSVKGSSDERYHAVRLLARGGGTEAESFLSTRLEVEKSAKVLEAIREALASSSAEPAAAAVDDFVLAPIPDVSTYAPLDKEVLTTLRAWVQEAESRTAEEFSRNAYAKRQGWTRTPVELDTADRLFEALQNLDLKDRGKYRYFENSHGVDQKLLNNYPIPAQFQLIHVIRWCLLLAGGRAGQVGEIDQWSVGYQWRGPILSYQKTRRQPIDLRELAAVFRAIGIDDRSFGRMILQGNRFVSAPFLRTDPDRVWPYFAERPELLEEALGMKQVTDSTPYRNFWVQDQRQNAFNVLKLFPRLPSRLMPLLWSIALGAAKSERPLAQECLEKLPDKEEKIIAALSSRQQEIRLTAAQWLAALDHQGAIPALRGALAKEKSEVVKDELIKALETLGVKLEELLDLNKLDQEAARGLKKGIPKDLEWFPFAQLPTVAWADSGKPVPKEIINWFLVQGHKLNTAEANPTLRRYCSLLQKDQREQLGRFVMEAWIAQDTKPKYTADQAGAMAQKEAQQMAAFAKQYPQYYPNFDEQRAYQTSFNRLVTQPEGSQTATKGILALAGACCSGDAAPIVHRYVKQWYGYRPAQCKALLQVLAWIDHPSATQVVLSVANRFRTKGIQEEALRQCQLLAERKGWTLDELADRTIPTAGFDEAGHLELDYGPRQFTAALSEATAIVVTNQDGKTIASLPEANQSDDAEKAKQAKSAISTARKELKSVLTMQRDRFYEALCTQRSWRFEDWDTYLRQHPIVGRYCQRLIWVAYNSDKSITSFRPLSDGTLTNHQDEEVKLDPDVPVRLAHEETLVEEDRSAWLQHLSDYKVEPLFQQFGKQSFTLPADRKEATESTDFLGHIVKAFSLRNRLTRLGYTRGAAQDAGWFYDYRKTFLSLGLEAVIEFTGNGLPEENRTVALRRLYFARKLDDGGPSFSEELNLGELPRVLLSECWNDMRMAAAEGPGFAADWEKQTEM